MGMSMRRTSPLELKDCLISIWQGKNFPEGFDAGDAVRLFCLGWVQLKGNGGFQLTDSGLQVLNLAEGMLDPGRRDGVG